VDRDQLCIDTIRTLGRFDPEDPIWPNRDRFVLFAGGPGGRIIGMETFGASAPLKELQKKFETALGALGRRP
jgi:transketolase